VSAGAAREAPDVETASEDYARRFSGPVGAFFLEVQARTARELLAPWPGARVLDVGGGHAQLVGPLVDAGWQVTASGSDDSCARLLDPWLRDGRARFERADLLRSPWPDRAFDVVTCFRLLPHLRRWPELVAELARLARHAVVVDYPTRRSVNALSGRFFGLKKGVEGNTRPFTVFRDVEIEAAFRAHGLAASARRPQFLFPMALHRLHGSARLARLLEGAARALGLTRALGSPVILRLDRRA
jgi:2-polyprenyl-3-methyl-5-hydroxy-6-metoxy-1,4-benzoquinol methylase